jgi:hypothetical protein
LVFRSRFDASALCSFRERSKQLPRDFVELALATVADGPAALVAHLAAEFRRGTTSLIMWRELMELGATHALGSCSLDERAAWLATGVGPMACPALMMRIAAGDVDGVKLLYQGGARDVMAVVCGYGIPELVQALIGANADVNAGPIPPIYAAVTGLRPARQR